MASNSDTNRDVLWSTLDVGALDLDQAWIAAPHTEAEAAATQMRLHGFDIAPLDSRRGLTHFVSLDALESAHEGATVTDCSAPVPSVQKVTLRTPLGEVLQRLLDHDWLFATDALGGVAVITIADIARPAFTAMALSTVLGLEQRLNVFMELFEDAETLARTALSDAQIASVDRLISLRRQRRQELSFVQSLALEHRFDIVRHFEPLWAQLATSKNSLDKLRSAAQRLRDTLAHGSSLLHVDGDGVGSLRLLLDLDALSKRVAERVDDQPWTTFAFADVYLDDGMCLAGAGATSSFTEPLWVITAENPAGIELTTDDNTERTEELTRYLDAAGVPFQLGRGGRGLHWERSAIVEGSLEAVASIASRFQQIGMFQLTRKEQHLIRVVDGAFVRTIPRVRRSPVVEGHDTRCDGLAGQRSSEAAR